MNCYEVWLKTEISTVFQDFLGNYIMQCFPVLYYMYTILVSDTQSLTYCKPTADLYVLEHDLFGGSRVLQNYVTQFVAVY